MQESGKTSRQVENEASIQRVPDGSGFRFHYAWRPGIVSDGRCDRFGRRDSGKSPTEEIDSLEVHKQRTGCGKSTVLTSDG